MTTLEMSAPHNWCDRSCERCPLRSVCPIPDDDRDLDEVFAATASAVEAEVELPAGHEALDVAVPARETALAARLAPVQDRLLLQAAFEWATSLRAILGVDGRAALVAGKIARVASEASLDDPVLHEADVAPNLILIERILDDVRADVEGVRVEGQLVAFARFHDRDRCLRRLLAPLFASISPTSRATLAALAAAGRAPSPFCSEDTSWEA
jgi:hypothetical protein